MDLSLWSLQEETAEQGLISKLCKIVKTRFSGQIERIIFLVVFACSQRVHVGSLKVLRLSPTTRKHASGVVILNCP